MVLQIAICLMVLSVVNVVMPLNYKLQRWINFHSPAFVDIVMTGQADQSIYRFFEGALGAVSNTLCCSVYHVYHNGIYMYIFKKISWVILMNLSWHLKETKHIKLHRTMITSSNGNIFRVTGSLCGEFTGPGEFPAQRPVTRSFDVFFDLRLNKILRKQPWGW